jgi:hypothetical protein
MKVIPTKYNNILFRSRLEAKWAYYFDLIGLEYEYEYESFELDDGSWYVPDFYINSFGYIEIKPIDKVSEEELNKVILLSKGLGEELSVSLFEGEPSFKSQRCFNNGDEMCQIIFCLYSVMKWKTTPYYGEIDINEKDIEIFNKISLKRWF